MSVWIVVRWHASADSQRASIFEYWVLGILCLAGAALTVAGHRPDADDEYYVGFGLVVLEYPALPLSQLPGEYWQTAFGMMSYELLRAWFSSWTGAPLLSWYYLMVPGLFAVVLAAANYRLLRYLNVQSALLATIFFFVVLLTWGDTHRAPGHFAFLRLFQGKALLASTMVPIILYYGMMLVRSKNWHVDGRVCLAIICALGLSPTALVIGPLVAGLVVVSVWRPNLNSTLLAVKRVGFVVYPALIAAFALFVLNYRHPRILGKPAAHVFESTYDNVVFTLGDGPRMWLGIVCFLMLPLAVVKDLRPVIVGFVVVATLVLLNPWSSQLFISAADSLAWRHLWAIPFALSVAIVAGTAICRVRDRMAPRQGTAAAACCFVLLCLGYALLPGQWTVVDAASQPRFAWPDYKLHSKDQIYIRHYYPQPAKKRGAVLTIEDGRVCSLRIEGCF